MKPFISPSPSPCVLVSSDSVFLLLLWMCLFTWTVFKGEEKRKGEDEENHKSDFTFQSRVRVVTRDSSVAISNSWQDFPANQLCSGPSWAVRSNVGCCCAIQTSLYVHPSPPRRSLGVTVVCRVLVACPRWRLLRLHQTPGSDSEPAVGTRSE